MRTNPSCLVASALPVSRRVVLPLSALVLCAGLAMPAAAQPTSRPPVDPPLRQPPVAPKATRQLAPPASVTVPAEATGGPFYNVSRFIIKYAAEDAALPPADALLSATAELGEGPRGFTGVTAQGPSARRSIAELNATGGMFDATGIAAVGRAVVVALAEQGVGGVVVAPSGREIDATGQDLRNGGTELTLVVSAIRVQSVQTLVTRAGATSEPRVTDGPKDVKRIRSESPVQPGGVLLRNELENYLFRLNRTSGRAVDAAISADDNGLKLDYLITESKPWTVYFQLSNTGTEQTTEWRERIGFLHTNLTGNGDVLQVDYQTAGFKDTHYVLGSYDRPLADRLRAKIQASYNKYTASDVGIPGSNFLGETADVRAEVVWNALQQRATFLDVVGGLRYAYNRVENEPVPGLLTVGDTGFFLPYGGVRVDRFAEYSSTTASAMFEGNIASIATNSTELDNLGRTNADDDFILFRGQLEHSFYIEPTFNLGTTQAHELVTTFTAQSALGSRLTPNFQSVAGGFYSIRGYPEAVSSGDDLIMGTLEYRLHIPRLYSPKAQPGRLFGQPFRWSPTEDGGRPDWDMIFRAFVDGGRVSSNDRLSFETNDSLWGAGVGLEFQLWRNASLRADWAFALTKLQDALGNTRVDEGDDRVHILFSLSF